MSSRGAQARNGGGGKGTHGEVPAHDDPELVLQAERVVRDDATAWRSERLAEPAQEVFGRFRVEVDENAFEEEEGRYGRVERGRRGGRRRRRIRIRAGGFDTSDQRRCEGG